MRAITQGAGGVVPFPRSVIAISLVIASLFVPDARAGVTLDGSFGTSGPLAGPDYVVPAQVGRQQGGNLFHSFGAFSIQKHESATFTGPTDVKNVLARVTGGDTSLIDGRLASAIDKANLYLINPSGVVFGPNATLDVSGSFYASTADYLQLSDGGRFNVRDPSASVLTVAAPSAFGFLGQGSASIYVQGANLRVPQGERLALVGGDLSIEGLGTPDRTSLVAPAGRIDLAAIRSAGEVAIKPDGVDVWSFETLGDISLSKGAIVSTSGDPGGTVYIRGGRFIMDFAFINASSLGAADHPGVSVDILATGEMSLINGSEIASSSFGAGDAGDIRLVADRIDMAGAPPRDGFPQGVFTTIGSRVRDAGDGGDVDITARRVELRDRASVNNANFGAGRGGDISLDVSELRVVGENGMAFVTAGTFSAGDAGNIRVDAHDVYLRGGAGFTGITTQVATESSVSANAGVLRLNARRLELRDGAQISAGMFGGQGRGGEVVVSADEIHISGRNAGGFSAGIFATVSGSSTTGFGGNIGVTANSMILRDRGQVGAFTTSLGHAGNVALSVGYLSLADGSFISSSALFGRGGNAGNVRVSANSIRMSGLQSSADPFGFDFTGISSSSSRFGGLGGTVDVTTNSLEMKNRSSIASVSFGPGRAGDIRVDAKSLELLRGSTINASAFGTGAGGKIQIKADRMLVSGVHPDPFPGLDGTPTLSVSTIGSQTVLGGSNAGDISIETGSLDLLDGGSVTSQTFGDGSGGQISISADRMRISGFSSTLRDFLIANHGPGPVDPQEATRTASSGILASAESQFMRMFFGRAAKGAAGGIALDTGSLELNDHGRIDTATDGDGAGGNIAVTAKNLGMFGHSEITAESTGSGDAGGIRLLIGDSLTARHSSIATRARDSEGGNIEINARHRIYLTNSRVTTSVQGGTGDGGNIMIDPDFVILKQSEISANAFGGNGGNITIVAGNFIASPDSTVTASSALGIDGTVVIQAPGNDVSGSLETLPEATIDGSALFKRDCAAIGGQFSSFILGGAPERLVSWDLWPSAYPDPDPGVTSREPGASRAGQAPGSSAQSSQLAVRAGGGCAPSANAGI